MNRSRGIWLGHRRTGGRFYVGTDEMFPGVNILGSGADKIATVMAAALAESGKRTLVLDFGGRIATRLAGRFEASSLSDFLYDSQRMEERASLHAELAGSAFAISLNLNFEQEAFLNSAIQYIGLEEGVASPASLTDRLIATGEFRGHTADELRGKLGALRSLNLSGETGVVRSIVGRSSVASFGEAESHQAAEVAVMLFVAKVLALGASGVELPEVLILNEANRVFANLPMARHTNRLLTALLSAQLARVFASEVTYGLDHHILDTSSVKILSSSLVNETPGTGPSKGGLYLTYRVGNTGQRFLSSLLLTPNMYALQDSAQGFEEIFILRELPQFDAEPKQATPRSNENPSLIKRILETLAAYDHATRGSVVGFLSDQDPPEEIQRAIDGLQADGYIMVVGRDVKTHSPIQTFRLTEKGYGLLRSLR